MPEVYPRRAPITNIDFKPALVYTGENGSCTVVFWVRDPQTGRLKRVRKKFNRIKDPDTRRQKALAWSREITRQLATGWNPLVKMSAPRYQEPIQEAIGAFLAQSEKLTSENALRADTLRAHKSHLGQFLQWLGPMAQDPCYRITDELLDDFLTHIHLERCNTARTRNNYLSLLRRLCSWMQQKKYLLENPTTSLEKLPEADKKRKDIPPGVLQGILEHLKDTDPPFFVMCLLMYYCFIRRTELTRIRVDQVSLARQTLYIPAEQGKNGRNTHVTIPRVVIHPLGEHLGQAPGDRFVFSRTWKPGGEPLTPKMISDKWAKVRRALGFPKEYQFYSLKDTGITTMLRSNIPAIIVRDQARHYDLSVTDKYTPKEVLKSVPELANYS